MEAVLELKGLRNIAATVFISGLFLTLPGRQSFGAECSAATYNSTAFEKEVSQFSPYEKIYLIVSCTGLNPGEHTMHANWVHGKRGLVRSDKHEFQAETPEKRGIYFWFKLNKKGPMASMLSNQDFHEENFGVWAVETYLDDELVVSRSFTIVDGGQ